MEKIDQPQSNEDARDPLAEEMAGVEKMKAANKDKKRGPAETYKNSCELPDFSMGKIIICKQGNEVKLFGDLRPTPRLASVPMAEAKDLFLKTSKTTSERLAKIFGFHADIKHEGQIIGGAFAMVYQGAFYFTGQSLDYGPVIEEDIKKCLNDSQVEKLDSSE